MADVPVIDFQVYGLDGATDIVPTDGDLKKVAVEMYDALTNVGCLYIKNHGIASDLMKRLEASALQFFSLPLEEKLKVKGNAISQGYVPIGVERGSSTEPDVKECYMYFPANLAPWPEIKYFKESFIEVFQNFTILQHRILEVLALSLNLEREFFKKHHRTLDKKSATCIRAAFYPKMPDDFKKTNGQVRCAEHIDYGALTFIHQDNVGGLQVKTKSCKWIDLKSKDGALVVLLGDLMQRWTSDKFYAPPHRVLKLPDETDGFIGANRSRLSLIYFGSPDADTLVQGIEGSKYEPIIASHHYERRTERASREGYKGTYQELLKTQ
ncbi:unnamed protein product [Owenia fusiformis]|uniref:Uncharacterized protein n=1 Tax=Owenia fusiformis TaxID=6347 RepID=A0A8J1TMV6_OWEFU|nr:unnamed protein product [Owenia fusiformis]